jgi:uncharacterized protein with HEPN domain
MDECSLKLLHDVRQAVQAIESFCAGKSREDYLSGHLLRSGVERQYEIIGEALNRLRKHDPATAGRISECDRIIAFRNVLAHGYDAVDDRISWDIVENKLPTRRREVERLVADAGGEEIA